MSKPLVSVVLPVYKEPVDYIKQAVDSILSQTFNDFELILIFDTGMDDPYFPTLQREIIDYYKSESKIRVLLNEKNIGLPRTLNKAIIEAKGEYIARMDADDISLPERLELQLEYMQKNDVDLCGARVYYIDENGRILGVSKELSKEDIVKRLYSGITPLAHPTMLAKKSFFYDVGLYKNLAPVEDYELLCRGYLRGKNIGLVNRVLLKYRINIRKERISSYARALQVYVQVEISKNFQKGLEFTEEDYFRCINKVNSNKLFVLLDRLSLMLDNFLQRKWSKYHHIAKWFVYSLSPYKFSHLLHALISFRKFYKDMEFHKRLNLKMN